MGRKLSSTQLCKTINLVLYRKVHLNDTLRDTVYNLFSLVAELEIRDVTLFERRNKNGEIIRVHKNISSVLLTLGFL